MTEIIHLAYSEQTAAVSCLILKFITLQSFYRIKNEMFTLNEFDSSDYFFGC